MLRIRSAGYDELLCWLLIGIGVLVSLFAGMNRWAVERENRTVAIVLDCEELQRLAALCGMPFGDLLREFKQVGATGVAVTEMKLSELLSSGEIAILPRAMWDTVMGNTGGLKGKPQGDAIMLFSGDYALLRALHSALRVKTGRDTHRLMLSRNGAVLLTDAMLPNIGAEGLGINPRIIAAIKASGLSVVARLSNTQQLTDAWLSYILKQVKSNGVSLLVFDGEEVLGYRELISDVAKAMRQNALLMATIEFAKQRGEQRLARELDGAIVRLHSVTRQEMALRSPDEVVQRFVRAVSERNVRVCYVRIPPTASNDALESTKRLVGRLSEALKDRGFTLGMPEPFEQPLPKESVRVLTTAISSVAAVSGFTLLLGIILPLKVTVSLGLLIGLSVFALACAVTLHTLWILLCALAVALTFPMLAMCVTLQGRSEETCEAALNSWRCISLATVQFAICSAVTLCGGALIISLLCDRRFMVVIERFRGVKLSQLLPVFLLAAVLISGWLNKGGDLHSRLDASLRRLKGMFSSPVLWWHAAVSIFILAAGAYWIIRTGNIVPEAAPTWELKLRELLERLLIARPRFKEAFIGHPMLVLGFGLRALTGERVSTPLLLVGFIGQLSMLNTFTHIHTPLNISLLRTAHGLWIGWLIGAIALAIICFVMQRAQRQ
ncbi:MAG: DUF5693 family protein [Armatimonadota bacterium]|nr:DUF5693 family protein [Armatimonadota bacterium]